MSRTCKLSFPSRPQCVPRNQRQWMDVEDQHRMALKKSQLYSSLWESCDQLRGGMDASQYKDYVLTLLFIKYASDKASSPHGGMVEVPAGTSFADLVKLKGNTNIGEEMNKVVDRLAKANDLEGVIDQADFEDEAKLGSGKAMVDCLSSLIGVFSDLDLRANRAEGDDLLGDAYEYLMRKFATESGKSKGQFYTPAEVSRIMAQVVGIGPETCPEHTVYDPTCGSGSLLLKAADQAPNGISIYGQEMDVATYALARQNMFLHGHPTHELARENTLAAPQFRNPEGGLKLFDYAVANPPFSAKAWSNGVKTAEDEFGRFEFGVPPKRKGDYAFLLHLIKSLKSTGKGAIILPHGVLIRGNKEAVIRRNVVRRGYIKGIIGLPSNLFYGTGIPACIIVVDKERAKDRSGIFMIDASRGCVKDGNKNRLRAQDIHKIVDVFNRQLEVPRYSRMVPVAEIASAANDYDLNLPRYIDSGEPVDVHDLDAHLNGGIPNRDLDALGEYWEVFPSLKAQLFAKHERPGYSRALVQPQQLLSTIADHSDVRTYSASAVAIFQSWRQSHEPTILELGVDIWPRELILALSEDLLQRFAGQPLLDPYDVYQSLLDYWDDVMQDDAYLVAADGWVAAAQPRSVIEDKDKKIKETPDLVLGRRKYKLDLLPPALIVTRYFIAEQSAIEDLQKSADAAARALEEFVEENTGEEGLLEDATNDQGKVTKGAVKEQIRSLDDDPENDEERDALNKCLGLIDGSSAATKAVKEAQTALDTKVIAMYPR